MPIVNTLRVRLDDTPGSLAKIANTLGKANININGLSVTADGGRLYVDDTDKALATLKSAGIPAWTYPAFAIETEDKPGTLGRIASAFAEHGINIDNVFLGKPNTTGRTTILFGVSDIPAATRIEKQIV